MAISERLALLVTLDANGAIRSFNDLGKAADKNLSKADQRLDKMGSRFQKAGAGMLATAGLLGVGLYKAAQSASDLEQAVGGTEAVFGKASATIDNYAKKAAQAAGLSESAFRSATTSIGGQLKALGFTTGQAADQAVELTQVAADLSATYGGTTAEAVAALGAAFRGEADPAERFNLRLNQTTVNAKAVALGLATSTSAVSAQAKAQATLALIMEQSKDAQGQFAREADSAAGSLARFAAESENLKASVGQAVAPVLADVADGLGGIAEGFNNLSPAQQDAISKFALIGTGALGAGGALSFTIGKVIDARDRFGQLAKSLRTADGSISQFGKVAGGVTFGVGLLALALFKAQQRAKDLRAEAQDLAEQAESTGKTLREVAVERLAKDFSESDRVAEAMERLGVSFEDLAGPLRGSEENFERWRESLVATDKAANGGSDSAVLLASRVESLREVLGAAEQSTSRHAEAAAALGVEMEGAAPKADGLTGAVDDQKDALDLATESLDKFKKGMDEAFGALTVEEALDRRTEAFADMASEFEAAQDRVTSAKQRVDDLLAIKPEDRSDTFARDLAEAQKDVRDAIAETSRALDGNSESALRNRENIRGAVEDVGALIQLHRDEGASLEELEYIRDLEKANLERQLEQLGFNREEIQKYIQAIEDIPITKETTITADTAPAQLRIKELAESLTALAPEQKLGIDAAIIDRNLQRAQTRRAIGGPVTAGMGYSVNEYLGAGKGFEWFAPANGTVSPTGPGAGTAIDQTVNIYNPLPEPPSVSARALRRVAESIGTR